MPISTADGSHFRYTAAKHAKEILVIKVEISAYLS